MTLDESACIKQFECTIVNSRKINIKAKLEIDVKIYSNENVEIINKIEDIDDIQVLNSQIEMNSLVGAGDTKAYVKDTISIDMAEDLAEVMQAKFKLIDKEVKISYNKVLVKADSDISIMYLTEDNRIKTLNAKLPVMGFIEIPNINEDNICDVKYKLKNIIVKPNNMEQHSVYIEAEIEIICFAYETKYINIIEDIYSTSSNLNFTKKQIKTISDKRHLKDVCNMKEQIVIPEIGTNELYDVCVKPNITNMRVHKGKTIFEGEVSLKFLFEFNNMINEKSMNLPFNFEMISDMIEESMKLEPDIDINKENFIVSNGSIDAQIDLEFNLNLSKERDIDIIEEIMLGDMKEQNSYSMIVYFVKPGDTLWKIAKNLRSTIEDIQRVNEIDDVEQICEGQQLFIPKYVRSNVAI